MAEDIWAAELRISLSGVRWHPSCTINTIRQQSCEEYFDKRSLCFLRIFVSTTTIIYVKQDN